MELTAVSIEESYNHLALSGKLDIMGVNEVENKFLGYTAASKKNAIVDFSDVTFLGSMGIRLLIGAAKPLALEHKKLVVFGAPPLVGDVLEASGIGTIIFIAADLETALAALE